MMNLLLKMLDIELPIIQAPMAGVQGSALAAAVSGAGGLGSLPCAMLDVEAVRSEMSVIRQHTMKPVNLNFFCHTMPQADVQLETKWRSQLGRYYRQYGIDEQSLKTGAVRTPFTESSLRLLAELTPAVVSFHFGLPEEKLLDSVKALGIKILASATTVQEALWLENRGVDAIIAQGIEAGGHRGMFLSTDLATQMGTFSLLPQIVHAVGLPVIAAGGVADAQGVRAALDLGASAVQMGTAFLLCSECNTSVLHREALMSEAAGHTAITNVFSGRPARSIVNRLVSELGPINEQVPAFPLAGAGTAQLRSLAEKEGCADFTPLWCGQNASGCKEISATELVRELAQGAQTD
ncbi:MAG: nitronate monooxygenase [Halioglobus sp.]